LSLADSGKFFHQIWRISKKSSANAAEPNNSIATMYSNSTLFPIPDCVSSALDLINDGDCNDLTLSRGDPFMTNDVRELINGAEGGGQLLQFHLKDNDDVVLKHREDQDQDGDGVFVGDDEIETKKKKKKKDELAKEES
jgi:hypothetical protein